MTHVPFVDLRAQTRELHDELHEVFESVLSRAAYTMGPELGEFEAAFAAFCGADDSRSMRRATRSRTRTRCGCLLVSRDILHLLNVCGAPELHVALWARQHPSPGSEM